MQLYPVVYLGENEGRLVRHVVPKSGLENEISSYGSEKDFFPHVDNPDLKIRCEENSYFQSPCPDTLTLLCLRQVKGVATSLIFLKDVVSDLDEEDLELLQQNRYQVKRPASFSTNDTTLSNIPILVKDKKGDYLSRFDYHNVYSDSFSHNKALEKFKSISLQPEKWKTFYLKPGQAITFDNQKLLHTRNSFSPTLDGNDRWLLRVFGLFQKPNPKFLVSENCNHHLTVN
ncbi:MAG TPA: hypothetical protein DF294_05165 [Psychrobacter sp.]|nr:hypothetical protein [Psychrobacter sp.]